MNGAVGSNGVDVRVLSENAAGFRPGMLPVVEVGARPKDARVLLRLLAGPAAEVFGV